MQALLKFVFIVIAVFWLLRLLARLLFPWALKKASERMMNNARDFQNRNGQSSYGQQNYSGSQPDGKIRVDYVPPKSKPKKKSIQGGEFVDFEEVK